VAAKVRETIRAGADVIKIASSGGFLSPTDDPGLPNFSQAEVDAIVATAADLGRPVMSHAHGAEGIKRAVRAGVRSIDHGTFLDAEGIESVIMNEGGSAMTGNALPVPAGAQLPWAWPEVWVNEEAYELASQIAAEFEKGHETSSGS